MLGNKCSERSIMKRVNFKGRCEKRKVSKCVNVCRIYSKIQSAFIDILENDDSIALFECNVRLDEIIEKMGCCKQKALKLFNELKEFGLIECERIGLTKPNMIYVKTYY